MSVKEAIQVVEDFQKWRRGGSNPMPNPRYSGEAIDVLLNTIRKYEDAETLVDVVHAHPSVVDEGYEGIRIDNPPQAPKWVISYFSNLGI